METQQELKTQPGAANNRESQIQVHIEKPRLGFPISLIIDDGVPCINPLYYFHLQVAPDKHGRQHEATIPLDLLEQFAEVTQRHGMRGKFTVLPYPAGLGTILEEWEGFDRQEIDRWLAITRSEIAPDFDITPEILTHTNALELQSRQLIPQAEHIWMADRSQAELAEYMRRSVDVLRQAGFAPTGITQPCFFKGNRDDYSRAVLEALRPDTPEPDGTVVFYFVDFQMDEPPVPPHPIVVLDRETREAVVSILTYVDDFYWNTQYPAANHTGLDGADRMISADGESGRLADLIRGDSWTVFVTHWQSLYSNGTRQGLIGLDETATRLNRTFGPRLLWMTNSEIARYRVAEETTQITALDGSTIQLDALFACPDFTLTLQSATFGATAVMGVEVVGAGNVRALDQATASDGLLDSFSWRQVGDQLTVCFDLQAGAQTLRLRQ